MLSTCSRPPPELLKMRMFPRSTTYNPAHGSPSPKTISPGANWRGTARSARNCSSESVRPEKMATFASVRPWSARVSATEPIVANAARTSGLVLSWCGRPRPHRPPDPALPGPYSNPSNLVAFHVIHVQISHPAAELAYRSVDMAIGFVTPADGARVVFLTADIGAGAL